MEANIETTSQGNEQSAPQNLEEWLTLGISMGWASEYFCEAHDVPPMTEEEEIASEDGDEYCAFLVRLWFGGRPDVVNYGRESSNKS